MRGNIVLYDASAYVVQESEAILRASMTVVSQRLPVPERGFVTPADIRSRPILVGARCSGCSKAQHHKEGCNGLFDRHAFAFPSDGEPDRQAKSISATRYRHPSSKSIWPRVSGRRLLRSLTRHIPSPIAAALL
jgi:hypothetical protein